MLERPILLIPPKNVTAKEIDTAHFQCDFQASAMKHLAVTEWHKNDVKLNNTYKFEITKNLSKTNKIHLTLSILNISRDDKATYTCLCYYNTTTLQLLHIYKNYSAQGLAILEIEGMYITYISEQ